MPIYEFECSDCEERFEELSGVGTERASCPICGAEADRRLSIFGVATRQPTANQQRHMEDARGTSRGGARERFQNSLDRGRAKGDGRGKKDV